MMRWVPLACAMVAMLVATAGYAQMPTPSVEEAVGLWRNPKGTVYVRTERCGEHLCGEIVCATPRAIEKARAKGAETLVGTRVLEDYRPRKNGSWKGKVFVPDRQSRFDSTLSPLGGGRLEIRGCMFAGLICKEQVWQRVQTTPCKAAGVQGNSSFGIVTEEWRSFGRRNHGDGHAARALQARVRDTHGHHIDALARVAQSSA